MNTWKLQENELNLEQMRKGESLFSQGNGYFGWRGTFEEGVQGASLEGCYINGFYESYPIRYPEIAYGYPEVGQAMLNLPGGKGLCVELDGEEVAMRKEQVADYAREMDFQSGVLTRAFTYTTKAGRAYRLTYRRFISFVRKHIGAIEVAITPVEGAGDARITSFLQMRVSNQAASSDPRVGTHLPEENFDRLTAGEGEGVLYVHQRTKQSGLAMACALVHDEKMPLHSDTPERLSAQVTRCIAKGETYRFTKYIAYCGDAKADPAPVHALQTVLLEAQGAQEAGFELLLQENVAYLKTYWEHTDISIEGDDLLQQGLRFNSFHLLQSVGRDGARSIAAKGLSGEGYEGHYFWDTEIYVVPALLYSNPEICKSLLIYRHRNLPAARARAREMGHQAGALFPWRTIGGTECSSFFPAGSAQYHINGDIAVAVKSYCQATKDDAFLHAYGAELLFETARLWQGMGHYNARRGGLFCIDSVTGPDEYTACVNNNFYTNRIARENLWYAHEVYGQLEREAPAVLRALCEAIGMEASEAEGWKRAADNMYFPYDEENRVFLQDDSFADKADWDFAGTPKENHPLLLHYHPLFIYRHRVLKQADTVLADFMFDAYIDEGQIKRDYDYYEPLTTHDSSLSACIYSIVASRIGYADKAYDYFLRSVRTDLDDHKGNTKDGVHIANMAGTAMCILHGFAGVRQWDGQLHMRPTLPEKWASYGFSLAFAGNRIQVKVAKGGVSLSLKEGEGLSLRYAEETLELKPGATVQMPLCTAMGKGERR